MQIVIDCGRVLFMVFVGLSGCVGLLALASPRAFTAVVSYGNLALYQGRSNRFNRR